MMDTARKSIDVALAAIGGDDDPTEAVCQAMSDMDDVLGAALDQVDQVMAEYHEGSNEHEAASVASRQFAEMRKANRECHHQTSIGVAPIGPDTKVMLDNMRAYLDNQELLTAAAEGRLREALKRN